MHDIPETRYAKSGEFHIAYQVIGNGPLDLVFIPGFVSNVETAWDDPQLAHFYRRLASFARVVLFDKRGTGMSDPVPVNQLPTLEQRMDDVRAVMDAVGSRRAALVGVSEGGPLSLLFSASHPDRTSALVIIGSFARIAWAEDYPCGATDEQMEGMVERMVSGWGTGVLLSLFAASTAHDPAARAAWARYQRRGSSPGAAAALMTMCNQIDARAVLDSIRVPTLVLHRTDDRLVSVEHGRYLARRIPGATCTELPGTDHLFWVGDADAYLDRIEEFITGERPARSTTSACSRRCCSPTSSARPRRRPSSAMRAGAACSRASTASRGARSSASAGARSTPRATASSRLSTARRAASAARRPSRKASGRSGSRCARACTPASAR